MSTLLNAANAASDLILAAPEPVPAAPPGMAAKTTLFLGWVKWGGIILGVAGIMIVGIMMAVGRRNRSSMAADAASGVPWILGGLSLVSLAGGIVGVVLG